MSPPDKEETTDGESVIEADKDEEKDPVASLNSSVAEIKESLERLTKSVGELNSKMRSTGDVLKWVLDVLSRRSEEKEALYLKNFEASTELLKNFMAFVESRVKPVGKVASAEANVAKAPKKEAPTKEAVAASPKKGEEYLVKPSMIRKLQEEEGKEKDRKSR